MKLRTILLAAVMLVMLLCIGTGAKADALCTKIYTPDSITKICVPLPDGV
ncbi:MAG: hypothetical protein LC663_05380 [Actinobacteria bacterium]|nr:hypothetical protein [Actinomycetota bacterium]